jgi:translocation and assembly module TamB
VSLSDNVVIDLDVARASVEGKVIFDWRGDPMPYANGRYDVNGTIAAFGQVLEISRGAVRFPDVPADNPILRIRAEREIFGNTQVKLAGVLVDGPLKRPSIDAYTHPQTTEERALTLLVTGSDFDYEQGVGSIDFGTYIAPRVFISYGIGVFDRDNIVGARFDLAKGFGIKASSGDKETGLDLNYRFEN